MWRLDVSAEAEVEIFEAALRYEREKSGLGLRFEADLERVFTRLADNPLQFPQVEAEARRALLRRFRTESSSPPHETSSRSSRYFISIDIQIPGRIAIAPERRYWVSTH
jgi:hypothetical protein